MNIEDVKVSIVVPAYNVEKYIGRCIESIIAQTHKNLEIIIVDDGSKDNTGNVVKKYEKKDSRIKYIYKENAGVTLARIRGIREADGDYIGFIDSDDSVDSDMYKRLLENAVAYKADISHCGYKMIFSDGRINYFYNTGKIFEQDTITGVKDLIKGQFIEPGLCNKIYKKELIDKVTSKDIINTDIKINEDLLMNFYLFKESSKSVYEDFCPYNYIVRLESVSRVGINENQLKDPMRVTRIFLEETQYDKDIFVVSEEKWIRSLISIVTMSPNENKQLIIPYRKEIRKELRSNIKNILLNNKQSTKVKIMALWAAIWPFSYSIVHMIYAKISGMERKYSIN